MLIVNVKVNFWIVLLLKISKMKIMMNVVNEVRIVWFSVWLMLWLIIFLVRLGFLL